MPYSWTGCYIGGEIGGLWARKEWTDNAFNDRFFGQSFGAHNANGFLGGFQAGCDYQFGGGFVIGIQADYDWTSAKVSSANVLVDPRWSQVIVAFNAAPFAQTVKERSLRGMALQLHPVQHTSVDERIGPAEALGVLFRTPTALLLTVGFIYEWRKGALEWE